MAASAHAPLAKRQRRVDGLAALFDNLCGLAPAMLHGLPREPCSADQLAVACRNEFLRSLAVPTHDAPEVTDVALRLLLHPAALSCGEWVHHERSVRPVPRFCSELEHAGQPQLFAAYNVAYFVVCWPYPGDRWNDVMCPRPLPTCDRWPILEDMDLDATGMQRLLTQLDQLPYPLPVPGATADTLLNAGTDAALRIRGADDALTAACWEITGRWQPGDGTVGPASTACTDEVAALCTELVTDQLVNATWGKDGLFKSPDMGLLKLDVGGSPGDGESEGSYALSRFVTDASAAQLLFFLRHAVPFFIAHGSEKQKHQARIFGRLAMQVRQRSASMEGTLTRLHWIAVTIRDDRLPTRDLALACTKNNCHFAAWYALRALIARVEPFANERQSSAAKAAVCHRKSVIAAWSLAGAALAGERGILVSLEGFWWPAPLIVELGVGEDALDPIAAAIRNAVHEHASNSLLFSAKADDLSTMACFSNQSIKRSLGKPVFSREGPGNSGVGWMIHAVGYTQKFYDIMAACECE
jgi:hypothetical protein